ncbi:Heavy metal RND efflux outer membrane protein, CzcC family [hydrothermal vent metagenome]|uniref:Heavy metal RND efflux outer membrane protein, CzcC family n=1 Tax=hydrothermal vent metagenome TaxID=652676 RepID=A0A3B0XZ32_9ZZZZ
MKIFKSHQLAVWGVLLASMTTTSIVMAKKAAPDNPLPSPALIELIQNSLQDNPQLQALKAELKSTRATLRAADQAVYNPELEFDYEDVDSTKNSDGSVSEGTTTTTLGISQTIDWGDQRGSRTAIASARLQKNTASYRLSSQTFISDLLSLQAEFQTQNELARLSNETLAIMQEFKEISENRYKAGDLTQVELNLALLAHNQSLMEQANTTADASQARAGLDAFLGFVPPVSIQLPEQLPPPEFNGELDELLQRLPIVKIQKAELNMARSEVALRKSEKAWNPTIGIRAGKEEDASLIGFNLSIPLNVRNTFSAEVDAAQQQSIVTEQRAHLAHRNIRARVISSTKRYASLLMAWNHWRISGRSSVDQQLRLIKQLWQTGDISAADYILQLKQALDTRATGLQLRNQLWQVAFDWMSLTDTLDNWLNITITLPQQTTGNK